MSLDEAYTLAHLAQCRLNKESSRPNRNLRYMVGHLNHYQSLRSHILDVERDCSKPQLTRTHASSNLSSGQPTADEAAYHYEDVDVYDEDDEDDIPYDDEADDSSLFLSRCVSTNNSILPSSSSSSTSSSSTRSSPSPSPHLPGLDPDDSDESDHDDYYDDYDGPVSPEDEPCPSEAVVAQISDLAGADWVRHGRRPAGAPECWEMPVVAQQELVKGVTRALEKVAVETR